MADKTPPSKVPPHFYSERLKGGWSTAGSAETAPEDAEGAATEAKTSSAAARGPSRAVTHEPADEDSADVKPAVEVAASDATVSAGLRRRRRRRWIIPIIGLIGIALLALFGYRHWIEEPPAPPIKLPTADEALALQMERVRNGESDTIEIGLMPVEDSHLEKLRGLSTVRTLILDQGVITDEGMEVIRSLPNLMHLRLRNSPITDTGLESILALDQLRVLNLPHARLTSEGLARLSELPRLRQLRIGSDGTEDLSRAVSQLKRLRAVHLINVPVTDEGLRQLCSLPHLESLYLDGPSVTEAGWMWLFENYPHLHVHIDQAHHDRDPHWHPHPPSDGQGDDLPEADEEAL